MFEQVGFFNRFAGKDWNDKRPLQRYADESRRLFGVLDNDCRVGGSRPAGGAARTEDSVVG